MKRFVILILTTLFFASCNSELFDDNCFLGTWYANESSVIEDVTVYSDYQLTFFKDYTYVCKLVCSTYSASNTYIIDGVYKYDDKTIWLNDNGELFGNGGYCHYSMYENILKISWNNATMVFKR